MSNTAISFPFFGWQVVTINTAMVANNGYISNSGGTLLLTLPPVIGVGAIFEVANMAGQWRVVQQAGQIIRLGTLQTTLGPAGYLESTALGDTVRLVCTVANTTLEQIGGPQGTITVN